MIEIGVPFQSLPCYRYYLFEPIDEKTLLSAECDTKRHYPGSYSFKRWEINTNTNKVNIIIELPDTEETTLFILSADWVTK